MAQFITQQNMEALEPLFKPWEPPTRHRVKNPSQGQPALIMPGRRPSQCPLVRAIRAEMDRWRMSGYAGVSKSSRLLLNYWFNVEHRIQDEEGNETEFRYHWAQREAIETLIYLYELRGVNAVSSLLTEFGNDELTDLALGIPPEEDRWAKYCCKIATGGGKTKVMSLAIVWSYFHRLFEPGSELAQHFVIIAPNLTVYERLKDDFENLFIFRTDPLLPEEWRDDFLNQMQVVLQDAPGGSVLRGTIYLTNIHRLYPSRSRNESESEGFDSLLGPAVKRASALDTGASLRERITSHPALIVLNDEAHHLHDPDLEWNRAIDALHEQSLQRGNRGILMQLDFTATPKHNNGELFRHIICDFPLGEAVDAGIVKVPVLGESDELRERGDRTAPADERFATHLKLGYLLYEQSFEEFGKVRKPILFVMTEDTDAANEIADYLDSDQFPLLRGRVLNVHTKLKGRVKTVRRGGREVKEFVENENSMGAEDLRAVREMSRELDSKDSRYRCVVSVMMLREGWDVRNVTIIVPLRVYSAKSGILPEQTLGRGLRRMFPAGDKLEKVTVIHHPAFRHLYEQELAQEGLDIAVLPIRQAFKQTVSVFVDPNKSVKELDIEIPLLSDSIETVEDLPDLTFDELKAHFDAQFQKLPVKERSERKIEYTERHLFTEEVVTRMQWEKGLLASAVTAVSYFVKMLERACGLTGKHAQLAPLVERFIAEVLFERPVNLYSGEVDHRMADQDVLEYIRATFAPLIMARKHRHQKRKLLNMSTRLSQWKPYQATSTLQRPAVPAKRALFNLIPCDNEFERAFADFCEYANDVAAFAKNAGPQKLMIDYLRPDGNRAFYVPDFFVRDGEGDCYLVETKGKEDSLVPVKAQAAVEWCKTNSRGSVKWHYLYVPYALFQQTAATTLAELARACDPSLQSLLNEAKTRQQALPLEEATALQKVAETQARYLEEAGVDSLPDACMGAVQQATMLLDYALQMSMPQLSHVFQPLLRILDDYAIKVLERRLRPLLPSDPSELTAFFAPTMEGVSDRQKALLEKNQRYLQDNLIYGRSMQRLGVLLFCLSYAQEWKLGVGGIWQAVEQAFGDPRDRSLYSSLSEVNTFRNRYVAHAEEMLTDPEEAQKRMKQWILCIHLLGAAAG
jgi:type III restriction enzyme